MTQLVQKNMNIVIFQHDEAPPHWSLEALYYLNETFVDKWCGSGRPLFGPQGHQP
jgi:hypothetical protein